jgi:6-phosphogluconolactonase (cycloisomerase 2 family)
VFRKGTIVLGFALVAMLVIAAAANASSSGSGPGAVYTLTNSPAGNAVIAFDRAADGTLSSQGTFATGGNGSGAGLGSQGAVTLTADGRQLLAVNAGSNSVSLFQVRPGGLELQATVASGGVLPTSVTVHGKLVYVLNAGGTGNITGFVLDHDGLAALSGSSRPLGAGSSGPAQVAFTPDGGALVVTEKSSSTIDTYAVGADGRASAPVVSPSAGGTPFGFDFDNRGHLLVSEAAGSASSYAVSGAGATVVSGAVATHQGAPCWLVASKNGRYAYTANAASGTISGFAVGQDGSLALLDPTGATASLGATSHPLDEAFSNDGQFLYNLTDGAHVISAFRVGADGSLTFAGSTAVPVGAAGLSAQ